MRVVCERGKMYIVGCRGLLKVWPNSICVSVVDNIAGDGATAGACGEATAGNDAGSHW